MGVHKRTWSLPRPPKLITTRVYFLEKSTENRGILYPDFYRYKHILIHFSSTSSNEIPSKNPMEIGSQGSPLNRFPFFLTLYFLRIPYSRFSIGSPCLSGIKNAFKSGSPGSPFHLLILFTYAALPLEAKNCRFFTLDKCLYFVYMLVK